ncbi:MAG: helicase-related protein, partial [Cyanobacteriota bacterium]|nr:helicase-related protein [Cyanobacteriota bacterium]
VVEQFAQEKEAVRILVATEVASEGLNLHYLSHRLVHVDIPWSLMTLQQRNGRIDRYGQAQQPQIRYLLSCSRSEGMGDAEKVLRLLKRKDEQAQKNIGDPAVFLGVYDAVGEEEEISKAFESGTVEALEQQAGAVGEQPQREGAGEGAGGDLPQLASMLRRQRRSPRGGRSVQPGEVARLPGSLRGGWGGLEACASDLNPVAVLINKAMIEKNRRPCLQPF